MTDTNTRILSRRDQLAQEPTYAQLRSEQTPEQRRLDDEQPRAELRARTA